MRYKEAFPQSVTGTGLLSRITQIPDCPWHTEIEDVSKQIELAYYIRSANKTIAPNIAEFTQDTLPQVILLHFKEKWAKFYENYSRQYNPLNAYTMEETTNRVRDVDESNTTTHGRKINESRTDTGTVSTVSSDNSNMGDSVYGFNSDTAVPTSTRLDETSGNSTDTRDLSGSREIANSGNDTRTDSIDETEEFSSTKIGNIGYSTPQELLRQDFELWSTPYFQIVFEDIDRLIMLSIYD